MRIRAHAISERGGQAEPFSYEGEPGKRDVLVRITHCSVARGDIQFIDDDWGDARFPLVPGHEIIGIVEEVGSEVADLRRGDRVGIGYQQQACFACTFCQQGMEQICPGQKVIAVDRYGGFADQIIVDGRFAFALPAQLDSATSTPLLSSGLTVFAGILRAHLADRSSVAVLGPGGLGHLAIQFLHKMGHGVSAFSRSPAKRELVERLGAVYVDSVDPEYSTRHRGSFDFILSTLNVPFDLDSCLQMLKPNGQLCLVASPVRQLSLGGGLLSNSLRTIYGNYTGSRADTSSMLQFSAEHGIAAIVDVMPFSRINEAIERVRRRDVPMGLVLENHLARPSC
ncbi:MAG TPA: NAD(P)-dependent alcohol dehydrogenase [Kofleriaceae bacterium]|nr:NAD(P)-dependent alcohol dehydrogenase [Kofleriaceae bacterium]